jgi:transient receptor potential cation channel subfamily M member 2
MNLANETNAWMFTNGLDTGVSKLIGQAKKEWDWKAPVIGIVPWGVVEGRQALWERVPDSTLRTHTDMHAVENFGEYEKQFFSAKPIDMKSVRLSREHSHFILVDDGTTGILRGEATLRARLEATVHAGNDDVQSNISRVLYERDLGWQQVNIPTEISIFGKHPVPAVCVCIEGGPGTIRKIHETIHLCTPVLLCKGTGKTTEMLVDAFEFVQVRPCHLSPRSISARDSGRCDQIADRASLSRRGSSY